MDTASIGDSTIQIIAPSGDVLLAVSDEAYGPSIYTFHVSSARLRNSSRYFNILLDPLKFYEGVTLESKLKELAEKHTDLKDIPISELPTISIQSVGQIGKVSSIRELIRDFLLILHWDASSGLSPRIPLSNLANLTIVADHFDALETLKNHAHRNNLFLGVTRRDSTPKKSPGPTIWNNSTEEASRKKIMIGVLLKYQLFVQETGILIFRGSKMWTNPPDGTLDRALWWNLPHGLEEELRARRSAVVSTLASIQTYFLTQYASGTQQCRLGYTSSPKCDMYQLGELTRFFHKLGILSLQSTMAGSPALDPFDGDIDKAIRMLKQLPPYQIDKDHAHCGPRDQLLEALELLNKAIPSTAVCIACWETHRHDTNWKGAKGPLSILPLSSRVRRSLGGLDGKVESGSLACAEAHNRVRDFFLASEKVWAEKGNR